MRARLVVPPVVFGRVLAARERGALAFRSTTLGACCFEAYRAHQRGLLACGLLACWACVGCGGPTPPALTVETPGANAPAISPAAPAGLASPATSADDAPADKSSTGEPSEANQASLENAPSTEIAALATAADDDGLAALPAWPRWAGPQGNGVVAGPAWSTDWNGALREAWRAEVGVGFSSMSVANRRLFTLGHAGGQETLYCLAADTGREAWKKSYPSELVDNLHEGGPGATPTVDGDLVYTLGRGGYLACWVAATGESTWAKNLRDELGVPLHEWGFTCSPLILGDLLIVDAGRVAAFRKQSGELVWKTAAFRAGYGSCAAFDYKGRKLITLLNNDFTLVLDPARGTELARFPWQTSYTTNGTTPLPREDTLFVSTGYDRGCALLRFTGAKLVPVYEHRRMSNHMANSVFWNGYLYGLDGNSHEPRTVKLTCMRHDTGEVRWIERGFGCGTVLISDGKLLILSDEGTLVAAKLSPEGYTELARARVLEGRCWTLPAQVGRLLYARNAPGDLVCVELPK